MKIAVFGKPGGGKSSLSVQIATVTGLPLYQLDNIQYLAGGVKVPDDVFARHHADIVATENWVMDGFGTLQTFQALLASADILVYVDRPVWVHYWWVTKRLLKSPFAKPLGWPEGSPILKSTLNSYRFLGLSHKLWTPAFRQKLLSFAPGKKVYIVESDDHAEALIKELKG